MTAKALAEAGHTVYASMRETAGRNASQVAGVAAWAAQNGAYLRTVELDVQVDASADGGIPHIVSDEDFDRFNAHFVPPEADEAFDVVVHRQ